MMKITTKGRKRLGIIGLGLAFLGASLFAGSASAARFGVRVVDDKGAPIAGAAVCVGLHGNYKQFGAMFTDSMGNAFVDVPNVPLLVTVSKDRFTGLRTTEPARGFNLHKQFRLREGVPGPRCRAGSALAEAKPNPPSITISQIDIDDGAYSRLLRPVVTGAPSQYRVSTDPDFKGAKWKPFKEQIALVGELSDEEKIFLQMRRIEGSAEAWLEARSRVMTVRIVN